MRIKLFVLWFSLSWTCCLRVANNDLYFSDSFTYDLLLSPMSIAAGIAYGLVWGFIVKYVPERSDVSILILFNTKH